MLRSCLFGEAGHFTFKASPALKKKRNPTQWGHFFLHLDQMINSQSVGADICVSQNNRHEKVASYKLVSLHVSDSYKENTLFLKEKKINILSAMRRHYFFHRIWLIILCFLMNNLGKCVQHNDKKLKANTHNKASFDDKKSIVAIP